MFQECCICYENISTFNFLNNKYSYCENCNNNICKTCNLVWTKNCPVCRSKIHQCFSFENVDLYTLLFHSLLFFRYTYNYDLNYTCGYNYVNYDSLLTYILYNCLYIFVYIFDVITNIYMIISSIYINYILARLTMNS